MSGMTEHTVKTCSSCRHYRRYAHEYDRETRVEYVCCALTGGALLMDQSLECREYQPKSFGGDRED